MAYQKLPSADIREGFASGPFIFAPGDTQEVVFAEMIGEGVDNLQSVSAAKDKLFYYSYFGAYKNLINRELFPAPPRPAFTLSNNNNSFQIQWDNNAEKDNSFEGYNVYQINSQYDTKENAKLIATFDKVDGIKTIEGLGVDAPEKQQFGLDTGIQNNFLVVKDYINESPLIKGQNYYYAVTGYSYKPNYNFLNNTESIIESKSISYLTTDIKINKGTMEYWLSNNYPNPFNPTTTIEYSVPNNALISIKLFDILGHEVMTIVNEQKKTGSYKVEINANNLSSGVCFYRMQAGSFVQTKKLILLR